MRNGTMALAALALAGCGAAEAGRRATTAPTIVPVERPSAAGRLASAVGLRKDQPAMRWGEENPEWTEAALAALESEGVTLLSTVPSDVMQFCPGYATQTRENRAAFWAGLVSAVAHHEGATQGARRGLLQLARPQAQGGGCGGAEDGAGNLRCAVRLMAREVGRDGAIAGGTEAQGKRGWRGVARSWMPLRSREKRAEIAGWTRKQSYCR